MFHFIMFGALYFGEVVAIFLGIMLAKLHTIVSCLLVIVGVCGRVRSVFNDVRR